MEKNDAKLLYHPDISRYHLLDQFYQIWSHPNDVFVSIDPDSIEHVGLALKMHDFTMPRVLNESHDRLIDNDGDALIQYLGILSAMDFGVVYPATKQRFTIYSNGKMIEGSRAIDASLINAFTDHSLPLLDAYFLRSCSSSDIDSLFPKGNEHLPFVNMRKVMLNEIGKVLCESFGGQFVNLFAAARYNAFTRLGRAGIVEILVSLFPQTFSDISPWKTNKGIAYLTFHKRAQLFVFLYQREALSGYFQLPHIDDTDRIACVADYRVPQALHSLGCIRYSGNLAFVIHNEGEIPHNHPYEVQIRAVSTLACCALLDSINQHRDDDKKISPCHLDYYLYSLARSVSCSSPHHWTSTTAY